MKIEDLAVMIKRGFDSMATKDDLKILVTKTELQELRKEMIEGFRLVHDDLHDIKITIGPLVRVVATLNNEIANLRTRVERLEKRIGVGK